MVTYRQHKNVYSVMTRFHYPDGAFGCEYLLRSHPELETFMDFGTWLTFYNADPDNWYCNTKCFIPYYYGSDELCHCVKFASRRDFRKFKRWYKKHLIDKDSEQNLKEQSDLAFMVRKAAAKRTEEAIKKQKKADEELQEIVDGIARLANASYCTVATEYSSNGSSETPTVKSKKKEKKK